MHITYKQFENSYAKDIANLQKQWESEAITYGFLADTENEILTYDKGYFYIALDSDAIVMNEMFNLKLTKFSNVCDKCGFPKNSLEKYKEQLSSKNIEYKVIEQTNISPESMLNSIRKLLEDDLEELEKDDLLGLINQIKTLIGE